jgi:glycosyltransferase involved in cell wall biosynthesis
MYHNSLRQGYYAHFITKKCNSEDAKVSIIVPCYNTPAKYFEPLLASLFAQNYQNWELVLVDASSEPRNSKYLSTKKDSDTRIKYIKTSNEGIAA